MNAMDVAKTSGRLADEKKAKDVVILELAGLTDIADYFLVANGTGERHVRAVAENIETGMKALGVRPYSVEGYNEGRWVIIDYRNVIVHIFLEPLRELYDLESLWIEAKRYRVAQEKKNLGVENAERQT
jgi:ribosome-associated protein